MSHHVFILFADVQQDAFEAIGKNFAQFKSRDFGQLCHFFFVSGGFGDSGVGPAKWTVRIRFDFNFSE